MLDDLLNGLGLTGVTTSVDTNTRRRYARRPGQHAEVRLNDRAFPINDWSRGGLQFEPGRDENLNIGDRAEFRLKFRLPHEVIDIVQPGRVVRKTVDQYGRAAVGVEFEGVTPQARRAIERVIDGYNTQEFVISHVG